jgi:hypothetical protein
MRLDILDEMTMFLEAHSAWVAEAAARRKDLPDEMRTRLRWFDSVLRVARRSLAVNDLHNAITSRGVQSLKAEAETLWTMVHGEEDSDSDSVVVSDPPPADVQPSSLYLMLRAEAEDDATVPPRHSFKRIVDEFPEARLARKRRRCLF